MRKFNRTKIERKGPTEIKPNYLIEEEYTYTTLKTEDGVPVVEDGKPVLVEKTATRKKLVVGFSGYKGVRYHPTKGWKKEAGFSPVVVI